MTPRKVVHEVKIDRHWWAEITAGRKTSELRRDDRDYQIGDEVRFLIDGIGCVGSRTITHVLKNVAGLEDGYVVLSLDNPDLDWYRHGAYQGIERGEALHRQISALRGVITKQRRQIAALKGGDQ